MQITLNLPDSLVENVVKGIMENFPEASQGNALTCVGYKYEVWYFAFFDEDNTRHVPSKEKLLAAFPLIFTDKWPKGCTKPPFSDNAEVWDDWLGQADAIDFDAFVQLACFGEVIYG